jgi:capsid protein
VDPLRESKADRDNIDAGVNSPQRIAARRGVDIEEILDELGELQELVAERAIVLASNSTALANNPAANGAEERQALSLAETIRRSVEDALDRHRLLHEEN